MTSPDHGGSAPPDAWLRIAAFTEATTLLVTVVALGGRFAFDGPDISSVIGPVHGLAFLTYVVMIVFARDDNGWSGWQTLALIAAAIVPFGGYVAGRRLGARPV